MPTGLSFGLIHPRPPPFTSVRGPPVRAGHGRRRTVVNSGAQYSKACEGASLPWVQIPPPPPLTCKNVRLSGRQPGPWCSPGLIYWSQLRVVGGHTAGISRGCCAWSPRPRTGLNEGERRCARPGGLHATVQGCPWPVPDRPDTRQLSDRITVSDRDVLGERAPTRRYMRLENRLVREVARAVAVVRRESPAWLARFPAALSTAGIPSATGQLLGGTAAPVITWPVTAWSAGVWGAVLASAAGAGAVVPPRSFRCRLPAMTRKIVDG